MTFPATVRSSEHALQALIDRHRRLYESEEIDTALERIIRDVPFTKLSSWDIHRILRASRSVFFDTHVEVVSGHHTATYLRFESIARTSQFITVIARDLADWVFRTFCETGLVGIVTTRSDAYVLAERVVDLLYDRMRLRLVATPFHSETGKIGTEIPVGAIRTGERFLSFNDVTTRGMCVSKLGKVITDHGGTLSGMMVFARRDSGQFPLMGQLTEQFPFYFCTDLEMPQWEPAECPLCRTQVPLLSWRDMPEL
ncbi:hypothetical protein YTPLAS18_35930 [Nitrospira sp.]|nr:hypothetical protein YTPLAS18_35930 [Nitrospira sp.]